MPFSDTQVQAYNRAALQATGNDPHMAWCHLYQQRQNTDRNDTNAELGAAEHYMYARWQVGSGETNSAVMRTLAVGYDMAKLAGYLPAIWLIRRIMRHTWTPPSLDSIRWGLRGCTDGAADRQRAGH